MVAIYYINYISLSYKVFDLLRSVFDRIFCAILFLYLNRSHYWTTTLTFRVLNVLRVLKWAFFHLHGACFQPRVKPFTWGSRSQQAIHSFIDAAPIKLWEILHHVLHGPSLSL